MKKSLGILLLSASFSVLAANQDCRVVGVADGDTLTCLTAEKAQIKVRMNQIDAPEKAQPFGNASKDKLSSLVFGKQVRLQIDGKDKYGRTLAQVFSNSLNINKEMVRTGYAWAYRQYVTDQEYIRLESEAKAAKRGLWADPNPIYPSEFRRGKRSSSATSTQPTQPRNPQLPVQTSSNNAFSCSGKRVCREMNSCAEARYYLNVCGLRRLDRDNDGVPCESICR